MVENIVTHHIGVTYFLAFVLVFSVGALVGGLVGIGIVSLFIREEPLLQPQPDQQVQASGLKPEPVVNSKANTVSEPVPALANEKPDVALLENEHMAVYLANPYQFVPVTELKDTVEQYFGRDTRLDLERGLRARALKKKKVKLPGRRWQIHAWYGLKMVVKTAAK